MEEKWVETTIDKVISTLYIALVAPKHSQLTLHLYYVSKRNRQNKRSWKEKKKKKKGACSIYSISSNQGIGVQKHQTQWYRQPRSTKSKHRWNTQTLNLKHAQQKAKQRRKVVSSAQSIRYQRVADRQTDIAADWQTLRTQLKPRKKNRKADGYMNC